jgi:hypothetical protein
LDTAVIAFRRGQNPLRKIGRRLHHQIAVEHEQRLRRDGRRAAVAIGR